ncbi:MAG TPA: carbohydrate ABC transporter permease [Candidatus Baltobacteraceae bacterium]|nr:carbohydrate ABC transporter permease [Candidatus Baltobacteraceae bacterium]
MRTFWAPIGRLGVYIVVGGVAAIMILPFYWMVITSFMPAPDILSFPPKWFPTHVTFEHFVVAFAKAPWLSYYWNSLVVAVGSVSCSLLFGLFAGYAFAVYRFPLQNLFFLLILGTLMVPVQVTSVALYIQLSKIGWVDTFLGILAPNFASAFGVFMLRQGIKQIPVDVIEAARIDGAGEMRIVLTIIAPLIKTTVATVAMILFLGSWNDFLWPVIIINSAGLRTLPVGIALFKDPYGNINYGPLMAATLISTAPMLIAYVVSQKYMIRGIAMTGLKG